MERFIPAPSFSPWDEHNAAPGMLELLRAFVNTVDLEAPESRDELATLDGARRWLRESGLSDSIDEEGLELLVRFRETLRDLLSANAGESDPSAAWRQMQPFGESSRYCLRIGQKGEPSLGALDQGARGIIARLLAVLYDALGAGTMGRLKACRTRSCRWAFYDRSKNGSGVWCSMAVCGNRMKARRRRQRSAQA